MFSLAKKIPVAALLTAALVMAALAGPGVAVHAQDKSASFTQKDYAGTWNLMFQDKRFATLTLQANGDQLTGSMTNGSIDMDDNGKITGATGRDGTSPIVRTSFAGGVLHVIEKDGAEEMEWTMTLTSATTGELRMAGGAPANAEAIRVEKVWSEPPVQP